MSFEIPTSEEIQNQAQVEYETLKSEAKGMRTIELIASLELIIQHHDRIKKDPFSTFEQEKLVTIGKMIQTEIASRTRYLHNIKPKE